MMAGGWLDSTGLSEVEKAKLEQETVSRFLDLLGHREISVMRPLLEGQEV
jgi:hypothetical protein